MTRRAPGEGGRNNGYVRSSAGRDRQEYEHIAIAAKALGRALPPKARVHHVDENRENNANSNLVICPSDAYHLLLHQRMRALDACGHADWLKCWVCKRYDAPQNIATKGTNRFHPACLKARQRIYNERRKAA